MENCQIMISVAEAKKILEENSFTADPVQLALEEAVGLVLATDLFAGMDIPAYPQSSMDGYAFSFDSWNKEKRLRLSGVVAAGSRQINKILPGEATRIFTGAAVPPGADTVLMQEKSRLENGELMVEDENLRAGDHVRLQGSEIKKGTKALEKGFLLTPAAIGYLAGMGFNEVTVYPKPKIQIIVTGNELQTPGQPLQYGQVYESNSFSLSAALRLLGINNIIKTSCGDNLKALSQQLSEALQKFDLVLLTGGVSVGDYDFTLKAAAQCGVGTAFHKIKQRPGKPIYFGKKGQKMIFGLPGNPASVLSCFYMYVLPVIEKFMGKKSMMKTQLAISGSSVNKPAGISWFMKGYFEEGIAHLLDAQESYRLSSFARANCLIELGEDQTGCQPGDTVIIHLLPV